MKMKKTTLILTLVFVLCVFSINVFAGPFLVCDPPAADEQITHYEIYQDGVLIAATNDMELDGSVNYDLVGKAAGQYEFTAKACNVWGCSDLSNPTQSPLAASAPKNMQLTE
jgi:hypothetical protein